MQEQHVGTQQEQKQLGSLKLQTDTHLQALHETMSRSTDQVQVQRPLQGQKAAQQEGPRDRQQFAVEHASPEEPSLTCTLGTFTAEDAAQQQAAYNAQLAQQPKLSHLWPPSATAPEQAHSSGSMQHTQPGSSHELPQTSTSSELQPRMQLQLAQHEADRAAGDSPFSAQHTHPATTSQPTAAAADASSSNDHDTLELLSASSELHSASSTDTAVTAQSGLGAHLTPTSSLDSSLQQDQDQSLPPGLQSDVAAAPSHWLNEPDLVNFGSFAASALPHGLSGRLSGSEAATGSIPMSAAAAPAASTSGSGQSSAEGAWRPDYTVKVLMVGDSGVGKTALLLRFVDDRFEDKIASTVGVDFAVKRMTLHDTHIKVQVWDTAGQERFRTLTSTFYRGAKGVIFVYDVTRQETLDSLETTWLAELESYAPASEVVKMVVANKVDRADERQVSWQRGIEFARNHGCLYCETSAKQNVAVGVAFEELVLKILDTPSLLEPEVWENSGTTVQLGQQPEQETATTCSC